MYDAASERKFWKTQASTGYLDWHKTKSTMLPNLKPSTQTISLRLPGHLFDSIKTAANPRDVRHQSLIKVWLHEELQKL
jgi:hypothetical protein